MIDRDQRHFPLDDNGDVLWAMAQDGDNLAAARDIDFSVVFLHRAQAEAFCDFMADCGYRYTLKEYAEQPDGLTWDVTIIQMLLPTHQEITSFEQFLADESASGGGVNDGWGSFQQI